MGTSTSASPAIAPAKVAITGSALAMLHGVDGSGLAYRLDQKVLTSYRQGSIFDLPTPVKTQMSP